MAASMSSMPDWPSGTTVPFNSVFGPGSWNASNICMGAAQSSSVGSVKLELSPPKERPVKILAEFPDIVVVVGRNWRSVGVEALATIGVQLEQANAEELHDFASVVFIGEDVARRGPSGGCSDGSDKAPWPGSG